MSRGLIALVLICLLALLIIGCKAGSPATPASTPTGTETQPTGTGQAAETGITGDITEVDNLNNELNDPELDNTEDYLDEVNW